MRPALMLLLVLLALPPALAAVEPCLPSCTVPGHERAGFLPPVTLVESGATLTWTAPDNVAHTATDAKGFCFHTAFNGNTPGTSTFRLVGGVLVGESPGRAPKVCAAATPLPDGSFVLPYVCLYHPLAMTGQLVVRPAVEVIP